MQESYFAMSPDTANPYVVLHGAPWRTYIPNLASREFSFIRSKEVEKILSQFEDTDENSLIRQSVEMAREKAAPASPGSP